MAGLGGGSYGVHKGIEAGQEHHDKLMGNKFTKMVNTNFKQDREGPSYPEHPSHPDHPLHQLGLDMMDSDHEEIVNKFNEKYYQGLKGWDMSGKKKLKKEK